MLSGVTQTTTSWLINDRRGSVVVGCICFPPLLEDLTFLGLHTRTRYHPYNNSCRFLLAFCGSWRLFLYANTDM